MRPNREAEARQWLYRSKSNLDRARIPKSPTGAWEDPCLDAHQAVEKALKGIHVLHGIDYAWTHDIEELVDCLRSNRVDVPPEIDACHKLTIYSGIARYPSVGFQANESDWREALDLAERAVRWAESVIGS